LGRFVPPDQEEKIMFKKILVPLDGSDLAAKILPQIEELAKRFQAQVTLLTVGSSDTCADGGPHPETIKEGAACPEIPLARYLEQTAGKLRDQGVEVTWVYKQGNPAKEIVAYAAANDMDLIAIASHGGGEIAWLLGSVAHKVIAHAPGPVLLLRVTEPEPPVLKSELYYSLQTP
jgi:nucleotide-binding universal stress UspA family protein